MLVAIECIFSLFIGILIGICIERTANCLASQRELEDNYFYDSLDDFYYSDEFVNMNRSDNDDERLVYPLYL